MRRANHRFYRTFEQVIKKLDTISRVNDAVSGSGSTSSIKRALLNLRRHGREQELEESQHEVEEALKLVRVSTCPF